jgi:hypothetical protein
MTAGKPLAAIGMTNTCDEEQRRRPTCNNYTPVAFVQGWLSFKDVEAPTHPGRAGSTRRRIILPLFFEHKPTFPSVHEQPENQSKPAKTAQEIGVDELMSGPWQAKSAQSPQAALQRPHVQAVTG